MVVVSDPLPVFVGLVPAVVPLEVELVDSLVESELEPLAEAVPWHSSGFCLTANPSSMQCELHPGAETASAVNRPAAQARPANARRLA